MEIQGLIYKQCLYLYYPESTYYKSNKFPYFYENIKKLNDRNTDNPMQQSFYFDNLSPYIYFDDSYTPTRDYVGVTNDVREKWIVSDEGGVYGEFRCENLAILSGKVVCKDTPEIDTKENNTTVEEIMLNTVTIEDTKLFNSSTENPSMLSDTSLYLSDS